MRSLKQKNILYHKLFIQGSHTLVLELVDLPILRNHVASPMLPTSIEILFPHHAICFQSFGPPRFDFNF